MKISSGSEVVSYQYMDIMQEILTFKKKKKETNKKHHTTKHTKSLLSFFVVGCGRVQARIQW